MSTLVFEKEKGAFSRISEFLHNSIRKFSFQLMENNIWSVPGYLILLICEFVSQLFFPLEVCLGENYDSDEVEMGYKLMRNIQLDFYIRKMSSTGLIICISSLFLVFIAIMGYAIYKEYSTQSGQRDLEDLGAMQNYKIINFIIISFCCMLTIPIYICGLLIFRCEQTSSGYYLKNSDSIECGSIAHIIIGIISAFMILLFTIIIIIKELFMIDNYPDSKIPWAAFKITLFQLLKQFQKFLIVLFVIVEEYAQTYIFALVLYTLTILISCYLLMKNPPFYFLTVHSVSIIFQFILLIFSFLVFLVRLFDLELTLISIIIILIISIIFAILTIYIKQYRDYKILKYNISEDKEIRTSKLYNYLVLLIIELKRITRAKSNVENEEKMYSMLYMHQTNCQIPICPCSNIKINSLMIKGKADKIIFNSLSSNSLGSSMKSIFSLQTLTSGGIINLQSSLGSGSSDDIVNRNEEIEKNKTQNIKDLISVIGCQMQHLLHLYPKSMHLHLFSAFFSHMFNKNIYFSIYELKYIKEYCKANIFDQNLNKKYSDVLEKYNRAQTQEEENYLVDAEHLLEFEDLYQKVREYIITCSLLSFQFWQNIASKDFDTASICLLGTRLKEKLIIMDNYFERAIEINYSHYNLYREYGTFLIKVGNKKIEGEDFLDKGRKLLKELKNQEREIGAVDILDIMNNRNTCILIVSGNPDNMGVVLSCNNEIYPNLGYQIAELQGQNCSLIMPEIIGKNHTEYIQKYIQKKSKIKMKRVVFARDVNGFITPTRIYVKVLGSFQQGIKFIALLRRLESGKSYFPEGADDFQEKNFGIIITSNSNTILGINELCNKKLGIPVNFFLSSATNKKHLIRNLFELNENGSSSSEEDILSENIQIETIIPSLKDLELEELAADAGIETEINTKNLLLHKTNENLTETDIEYLETRTGSYKIMLKLRTERYDNAHTMIKIYYFYLKLTEELFRIEEEPKPCDVSPKNILEEIKERVSTPKGYKETAEKMDRKFLNYEDVSDTDSSSASTFYPPHYFEFKDFKRHLLTSQFAIIIRLIKYLMGFITLLLFCCSLISFIFVLLQNKSFAEGSEIFFHAATRHHGISIISSHIGNLKVSATTYESPYDNPNYPLVDTYGYSQEFLNLIIDSQRKSQGYIDSLTFHYTGRLEELEKTSIVRVEILGNNREKTFISRTINTAFQQYLSKSSDITSYSFERFKTEWDLRDTSPFPLKLERDHTYIFGNSLGSLNECLEEAAEEFFDIIKEMNIEYWQGTAICCIISLVCTYIALFILYPNILRLFEGKYIVIGLFAHIPENDSTHLTKICYSYYQKLTLKDYDNLRLENQMTINKQGTIVKFISMENKCDEERRPLTDEKHNESNVEEGQSLAIMDSNEMKLNDDVARMDIKRKEKNLDKIKLNKLLLFSILLLITTIIASYFVIMIFMSKERIAETSIENDSLNLIGNYINYPLHLLMYILYSVVYDAHFTRNGQDAINYYIDKVQENQRLINDFMYIDQSFLSNTQSLFKKLNSPKYCDVLFEALTRLENSNPEYSFEGIKTLRKEVCLNIYQGLLTQGLDQAITTMYKESKVTEQIRINVINQGKIQNTKDISLNNLYQFVSIYSVLITPMYGELVHHILTDFQDFLDKTTLIFILIYVLFLFLLIIIVFGMWPAYLKKVKSVREIIYLINLIPDDILYRAYESKYQYVPIQINQDIEGELK